MRETLLGGRYAVGGLLGAGASADVFGAVDVRLGRDVAIKIVRNPAPPGTDPLALLRAAARLDHPNVVSVLDAGVDDRGHAFVVLDLVVGWTLAEVVTRGPMDPVDAMVVIEGVLAGLAHAHERGVLHLDLSPANVMVSRLGGSAGGLLLDVGSTPRPDPAHPRVTVSPHYASPEVAQAHGADARSDVYSAGALLYHLVTGRPPMVGTDPQAVLAAQVHGVAPAPSALVPGLSTDIDRIVRQALAKDPARRYQSAAAMQADIADVLRRPLPAARPRSPQAPAHGAPPRTTKELVPVRTSRVQAPRIPPSRTGAYVTVALASVTTALVLWLARTQPSTADPADAAVATTALPAAPTASGGLATPQVTTPEATPVQEPDPPDHPVPELSGLPLLQAEATLTAAGLTVGEVVHVDARAEADMVLSSTPAAGQVLGPGGRVALMVATGLVGVPDVTGSSRDGARSALEGAGFVPAVRLVPEGPPDAVVGSDPAAGARARIGTTVAVLVGMPQAPPPTATATPSATPTPAPTPTPTTAP